MKIMKLIVLILVILLVLINTLHEKNDGETLRLRKLGSQINHFK